MEDEKIILAGSFEDVNEKLSKLRRDLKIHVIDDEPFREIKMAIQETNNLINTMANALHEHRIETDQLVNEIKLFLSKLPGTQRNPIKFKHLYKRAKRNGSH